MTAETEWAEDWICAGCETDVGSGWCEVDVWVVEPDC